MQRFNNNVAAPMTSHNTSPIQNAHHRDDTVSISTSTSLTHNNGKQLARKISLTNHRRRTPRVALFSLCVFMFCVIYFLIEICSDFAQLLQ